MVTRDEFKLLISGTQKDFEPVAEGKGNIPDHEISKLKEGDLILRNVNVSGSPFYHAGIYCGNEEVISFTAPSGTKWYEQIPRLFMPQQSASVIKESVTNFLNGKSFEVFRLKSDIPGDFSNLVKSGMKYNEEYDLRKNNSLHFALRLLKLPAEPLPERNSQSDGENTRACGSQIQSRMVTRDEFKLLISGTQKDFEPVVEGKGNIPDHEISKLKEGDLIWRNMNVSGSPSYHAGIYCGNEEVISFTAPSGTKWYEQIPRLLMPQQSASVIKESVTNFLNGKSYEVFRLKSGIPGDFSNLVKSGMKYNEEYNPCTNNSLHFALRLLKLPAEPLPERNSQSDGENNRACGSQIQNDDFKKPPVKNDEEGQSLLKRKSSESSANEGDKTADDDVKKPTVKNDEGQSLLKPSL